MSRTASCRFTAAISLRKEIDGVRVCVRTRKTDIRWEKFESGQERQGLKPDVFSIVCGPTKVVP